jgi:hypothetical protein
MSSISFFTIEGILEPPVVPTSCAWEVNNPNPTMEFFAKTLEFKSETGMAIKDEMQPSDWWQERALGEMCASTKIISITFIPQGKARSQCSMLLMHKMNLSNKIHSLISRYFSQKAQEELGMVEDIPNFHVVADENSCWRSINQLSLGDDCPELIPILEDFLEDPETSCLGATWFGPEQKPISWSWIKN